MGALTAVMASSFIPVSRQIISDVLPPTHRGKATFAIMLNQVLVVLLVLMLSGVVVQHSSWRYIPFALSMALLILCVLVIFLLPETIDPSKRKWRNPFQNIAVIFSHTELLL